MKSGIVLQKVYYVCRSIECSIWFIYYVISKLTLISFKLIFLVLSINSTLFRSVYTCIVSLLLFFEIKTVLHVFSEFSKHLNKHI